MSRFLLEATSQWPQNYERGEWLSTGGLTSKPLFLVVDVVFAILKVDLIRLVDLFRDYTFEFVVVAVRDESDERVRIVART